jgi:hypothetical protein
MSLDDKQIRGSAFHLNAFFVVVHGIFAFLKSKSDCVFCGLHQLG